MSSGFKIAGAGPGCWQTRGMIELSRLKKTLKVKESHRLPPARPAGLRHPLPRATGRARAAAHGNKGEKGTVKSLRHGARLQCIHLPPPWEKGRSHLLLLTREEVSILPEPCLLHQLSPSRPETLGNICILNHVHLQQPPGCLVHLGCSKFPAVCRLLSEVQPGAANRQKDIKMSLKKKKKINKKTESSGELTLTAPTCTS